eukprot:s2347_g9.t1
MNAMTQMSPTGFPIPHPVQGGCGTENFLREQILADRQQTQSRESQYQAQLNLLLQQQQNILSHLPFPTQPHASSASMPPISDPPPTPPQPAAPASAVTSPPAPPPLDPAEVASQILSACKESMRQQPPAPESTTPPSQPPPQTPDPLPTSGPIVTPSRPPLPRAHRSTPSVPSPRSPVRPRYAEAKRSAPRSRSPPRRRPRSPSRRRTRSHRSRPRQTKPCSPSIVRSPLKLHSRSPHRPPVQLREANVPTWSSIATPSGWIDYSQWKGSDHSHQSSWSTSWSTDWKDPKWPSQSTDWQDSKWGSQSSTWRSYDPPKDPPLDTRTSGNSSPPRTAFSDRRRPQRRRQASPPRSSSAQELPPGHVSLVDPSLKDEEWRRTVKKCLDDPTRTKAANEIAVRDRPQLANTIDIRVRDSFIARVRQIDPDIPPTRLQSLIHVLAASHLLSEVDFNRVEVLILPNTSQRAMVVRLPSFDDNLSKCEQPTYGCFAMGQCVTSRSDDIPNATLVDLLDRATTKGKGQQEILLALQYKGAKEHLALRAGGNDWAQLQCALKGVVTTSEKYTVRVYGFDANQFWQSDTTHHDCNKVNGLTLPRTIRSSAFTSKLDIEGCDPLALPLAALLYQQADNFWLRKLAHGRELYLIPTGDIATVVFGTELLSQLRNRGIDMDRISQCKARLDGQTLDKINNTKYAAKVVAEYIQQWAPMKATDPSSQHTITQLQQQVAELKQRLGDSSDAAPPEASAPPPSTSSSSAHPPSTPIARALQGNAATPPPAFEPSSLLVAPVNPNTWLRDHPISSLANRSFKQWLHDLDLNPSQRSTVERNLVKVDDWWQSQPDSAIDTVQRTALMMGIPVSILKGNFNDTNLVKVLTVAVTMSC